MTFVWINFSRNLFVQILCFVIFSTWIVNRSNRERERRWGNIKMEHCDWLDRTKSGWWNESSLLIQKQNSYRSSPHLVVRAWRRDHFMGMDTRSSSVTVREDLTCPNKRDPLTEWNLAHSPSTFHSPGSLHNFGPIELKFQGQVLFWPTGIH